MLRMSARGFTEARRLMSGVSAPLERRCLLWLATRLPDRIKSDHLTGLALVAMGMTGLSYYLAYLNRMALLCAVGSPSISSSA